MDADPGSAVAVVISGNRPIRGNEAKAGTKLALSALCTDRRMGD